MITFYACRATPESMGYDFRTKLSTFFILIMAILENLLANKGNILCNGDNFGLFILF
jgi:hypothetical protein